MTQRITWKLLPAKYLWSLYLQFCRNRCFVSSWLCFSVQSGNFLLEPKKYLISYNQLEPKIEASTFIDSLFYRLLFYCRYIGAVMMGVGVFNIVLVIVYTFWATNERVKVWNYQKQRHLIINANNGHCWLPTPNICKPNYLLPLQRLLPLQLIWTQKLQWLN